MIRNNLPRIGWCACVLAGIAGACFGAASLSSRASLRTDRNPLAVQGSAYGRLLARLSETTIDRVWHLGVEQIVPHRIDGSHALGETSSAVSATGPLAPRDLMIDTTTMSSARVNAADERDAGFTERPPIAPEGTIKKPRQAVPAAAVKRRAPKPTRIQAAR